MKNALSKAKAVGESMAGVLRRAIDPPLGPDARPLDVRRAIVETVERQVEPAGAGRRVLPGDTVRVKVMCADAAERRALEAVLEDLRDGIVGRLRELRCEAPPAFAIDVTYLRREPPGWAPGQRLSVELSRAAAASDATPQPILAVTVVKGQAAQESFTFSGPVIRIGRATEPTDERGRPRFNDIAFLENDQAENRTVTRGHAVIRFNGSRGEYRLFDEGSVNGTRIVRGGDFIDVPKRDPVGVVLRSGDELQFGKAAIRVRIGE
jgi:hypothetical protein